MKIRNVARPATFKICGEHRTLIFHSANDSGALLAVAPWNVPIWVFGGLALLVLIAGAALLHNVADLGRPRLDALSLLLISVGLIGILYGVSTVFEGSVLVASVTFIVGLLAMIALAVRQRRIDNPLLNLSPFGNRAFVLGVFMTMLGLFFVFAMNVVIPLFLQADKGLSPLGASLTLAPGILLSVAMGPVAGRLFDRHGGRVMIPLGYLIMAAFVLLTGIAAGTDSVMWFGILYAPAVLGTALVIGPAQTFALAQLERATTPHGVTVVSTSFQIAGCVGTSLGVGVFSALARTSATDGSGSTLLGFQGSVALVIATSLVGIVLSFMASRVSKNRDTVQNQEPEMVH